MISLAALLDIVVRADIDCGDLLLRPDDMLESGQEFGRKPPMGDENDANHRASRAVPT